jgi:sec-independent protein translocase protein TatA
MHTAIPGIITPGPTELLLIVLVLLLLFGAKKLPELARGTGKALRIFKSETKGLMDDDDDDAPPPTRAQLPPSTGATAAPPPASTEYTSPQSLPPTHTEK